MGSVAKAHRLSLPFRLESPSVEATEAAGEALALLLRSGDVVALTGPLGAGKTCFTRGLARGLRAAEPVASPTFSLVREYHGRLPIRHVDLYRLEPAEVAALDWRDLFYGPGVAVVEWADKAGPYLPTRHYEVDLSPDPAGDQSRRLVEVRLIGEEPGAASQATAGSAARRQAPIADSFDASPALAGVTRRVIDLTSAPADRGPSRVLAIDTSTRARSLAVLDRCLLRELFWPPQAGELAAEDLAGALRGLLDEAGLGLGDLDLIAVALGPGSFTGVKVGLAAAKALAYALGTPLVGVGTLDALAAGAFEVAGGPASTEAPEAVLALLDAKRGDVFGAAYAAGACTPLAAGPGGPYVVGPAGESIERLEAVARQAVRPTSARPVLALAGDWVADAKGAGNHTVGDRAVGNSAAGLLAWLSVRWTLRLPPDPAAASPHAADLALLAQERFAHGAGDDPFRLQPLYLREPGISPPRASSQGGAGR